MAPSDPSGWPGGLREQFDEFLRLADALNMPFEERCAVLVITAEDMICLAPAASAPDASQVRLLQRRLPYIVPLMRRTLGNWAAPDAASSAVP